MKYFVTLITSFLNCVFLRIFNKIMYIFLKYKIGETRFITVSRIITIYDLLLLNKII